MFGHVVGGRKSNTANGNRYFRYEVRVLHQNEVTNQQEHVIRPSSSIFLTIPFDRMNEEVQRIHRLGGKIVNIQPLTVKNKL